MNILPSKIHKDIRKAKKNKKYHDYFKNFNEIKKIS